MTRTLLGSLALAFLAGSLGACTPETPDAPSPDPADAAAAAVLTLDADGIGGLDGAVAFDTAAVRAALPWGFSVEFRSVETEAGLVPVLWALRDGQLVLEVYGDADETVGRIDAASEQVAGPSGLRVGRTFAEADGGAMDCTPGTGELSGRAVCRPDVGGPVRYVFASRFADPGHPLPPADSLGNALLERLVWRED